MTSSHTSEWSDDGPVRLDARTLESFLAGVEQRAFRIVRYAVGHDDDALDIVQDTMLKLVSRYQDRPSEEWTPLFYRILQNGIRDHHRRTASRKRWLSWFDQFRGDGSDNTPAGGADSYEDKSSLDGAGQLEADQSFAAVNTALEGLPRRQQQVFLLRCWEGMSTRETAQAMGCSEGSVKTHYFRALNALRQALEDHQP